MRWVEHVCFRLFRDWCPEMQWIEGDSAVWTGKFKIFIDWTRSLNLSSSSAHYPLFFRPYPWGSCPIFWVKKDERIPQLLLSVIAKAIVFADFSRFRLVFLFLHKAKISYAKWVTWKHHTISPEQQPVFPAGEMLANHWHMDVISVTLTRFGFYRVREKGR